MPFARSSATSLTPVAAELGITETAEMLAAQIASETSLARRAQRLALLIAMDTPEAAAALADLVAHSNAAVRGCGVDGLRRIDPAVGLPAIASLLANRSPDMRIRALDAIERVPDPEIEAWLTSLLDTETQSNVCAMVLDLLAEMGTQTAVSAIRSVRLRFANEPFVAFAADLALSQIVQG